MPLLVVPYKNVTHKRYSVLSNVHIITAQGGRSFARFTDNNYVSSPGQLGQLSASVAAHQPGELSKFSSSKPSK